MKDLPEITQKTISKGLVGDNLRRLTAADGYEELGMFRDCKKELDAIDPELQDQHEVLEVHVRCQIKKNQWKEALKTSKKLCVLLPNNTTNFLRASLCLNMLGHPTKAKALLLEGPPYLKNSPIYHYNLGCSEAMLGNVESARKNLRVSFKLDKKYREYATKEKHLKNLEGKF